MTRLTCGRCGVGYEPRLTGRRCPVCDAPVPGAADVERPERDRLLTIVLVAAALNVTLLLALAVAVSRAA
jgi:hypothetical protein